MKTLRVALAQINTTVGDLHGNADKVVEFAERAREQGADSSPSGAGPDRLPAGGPAAAPQLHRRQPPRARTTSSSRVHGITAIVGFVDSDIDIYNAAAVIHEGRIAGIYRKQFLPNYGVFDEKRYFRAGDHRQVFDIAGASVGVNICEDIWYPEGPLQAQALAGADVIININGSPFHAGKRRFRERMLATRAADNAVILCYVNLVGGQDELVFDGNSMVFDQNGELMAHAHAFEEDLLVTDLNLEALYLARLHSPLRRAEMLEDAHARGSKRSTCHRCAPTASKPRADSPSRRR